MRTAFFCHPVFLEHDPGEYHPECPDRLRAVLAALEMEEFALLDRRDAEPAGRADLARVHDPVYVDAALQAVPAAGLVALDHETLMGPRSGEAALRAAGAVCGAVDAVLAGTVRNAFCAVRPPGHHAEHDRAMGFCLFNNIAVGAFYAHAICGIERIAIVDFDVHHGNGSQHAFAADGAFFYASSHQSPCYPGTGSESEHGIGNILNVELPAGTGSAAFRAAYSERILPALRRFKPDLLMLSAGFDADGRDPLANLRLDTTDFHWVTTELVSLANEVCAGRLVSVLEGGYDFGALAAGCAAHVRALMAA